MSDIRDFVIENGVLKKYTGNEKEVVIPEGVTSIGENAFWWCKNLTTITIPDSVTSIGAWAFKYCTNLTTITIPDSVTSIGYGAFSECENLTAITTIPDSVTSIGGNAFWGCKGLADKKGFVIINGTLYYYCGFEKNVVIPEGVTSIGDSAFENCSSLTTITIPDSVTSIGDSAFSYCKNLTTITIPDSVKSMGKDVLGGCNKLNVINLPQNITSFKGSSLEIIWDALSKTESKEVVLKSFITQLPIDVLNDADLSKKIKANKKLIIDCIMKNDEAEALEKFFSLYKTIKFDEINEYIEKAKDSVNVSAFLLDYKNKNYTVEKQEKHENDKLDKELGLKERTLAEWKKIYLFDVNGDEATITGYKGLDLNVIIPSSIAKYKVVAIADNAFIPEATGLRKDIKEIRRKIESIVIPESVVRIGNYAFSGCKNLTTITIPDSVTSIGKMAFYGCSGLTAIAIPDSVTSIGESAFEGCQNLTAITIPDSVTSIGESAFSWCKNLTTITIPDSVTSIGKDAFYNCEKLTIHAYAGSYAEKYAKENKIHSRIKEYC